MMSCSWDMERHGQNVSEISSTIFCPFTLLIIQKIKILKNWKKCLNISSFYTSIYTKNHDHMLYCFLDMVCNRCNCYFSFSAIFCPFTFLTAWKIKILKKWKTSLGRYHRFTMVFQKSWSYVILFLRYGMWRM